MRGRGDRAITPTRSRRRGGHAGDSHANHERWLVSYADFITLLFAFFTTLYAISNLDRQKAGRLVTSMRAAFKSDPGEGSGAAGSRTPPGVFLPGGVQGAAPTVDSEIDAQGGALVEDLVKLAREPEMAGRFEIRKEPRGVVISLAEAGFFGSGDAGVKPEAEGALMKIASLMGGREVSITIEGHTDNRPLRGGRYQSNWELSTARATSVLRALAEKYEIDPKFLSASGYGEQRPVADNGTEAGRAKNRRVDIVIRNPNQ